MTTDEAGISIQELREEIDEHNQRYYVLSVPVISDYDFDLLLEELTRLEKAFPEHFHPSLSPSQRVGGDITKSFAQRKHRFPMLSLGNTYRS